MEENEKVLVVPRSKLFDGPEFSGFAVANDKINANIDANKKFVLRADAENDPSLKQIIPYSVVVKSGKFFLLRRLSTQGESRLHDKVSVGVGGHINPVDSAGDVLKEGFERELHEELDISGLYSVNTIGYVNDDSNDVGSVHFGLVGIVDAKNAEVRVRETDMMEGEFVDVSEVCSHLDRMETWSRILMENQDVLDAIDKCGAGTQ